jgi:NitT/TauT family transport system substrate-binding protein
MSSFRICARFAAFALFVLVSAAPALAAEVKEIKVAYGNGLSYLPLMVMESNKLIEKHARAAGLGDVSVTWSIFSGGNVMNDALLSDSLHFASGGIPPFLTLWARTRGNLEVRAVGAFCSLPMYLTTRNPKVRKLADFTDKDRIALPAVKVSIQAVVLQMAAEQAFGEGSYAKLDPLTVSLSNPDGAAAIMSGASEVTSHFTIPPFSTLELEKPGIHKVLVSTDVVGLASTNVIWTTSKFRDANPRTYAAFVAAMTEAINFINSDKRAAADLFIKASKAKDSPESVLKTLNDPNLEYTTTPKGIMKYVDFMNRVGSIKGRPATWRELFFPEVHTQPGS